MSSILKHSDIIGAWQRESLSVEGGEAYEDSNVLWLYAGDHYADIRWPKPGKNQPAPSAFAGRAHWNPPRMSFDHDIDLTREFTQDEGILTFFDGKIIENGKVIVEGKEIQFEEVWSRLTEEGIQNSLVAQKTGNDGAGYIIQVSDYAIAMEEIEKSFCAAAWKYVNTEWQLLFDIGDSVFLARLLSSLGTKSIPPQWHILNQ